MKAQKPTDAAIALAKETLTGDIRDFLLDRQKHEKDRRPWNERNEDEQKAAIYSATEAASALVARAVEIIAADGRQTMRGIVDSVAVKDGVKAQPEVTPDQKPLLAEAA